MNNLITPYSGSSDWSNRRVRTRSHRNGIRTAQNRTSNSLHKHHHVECARLLRESTFLAGIGGAVQRKTPKPLTQKPQTLNANPKPLQPGKQTDSVGSWSANIGHLLRHLPHACCTLLKNTRLED